MDKNTFLEKYNISEEDFNRTDLQWEKLIEIYNDFQLNSEELEFVGEFIYNCLKRVDTVHSVRQRIKNPEHLIEKIIRKKLQKPDREITLENYTEQITDLIGIRVIHLFKEDWESIHDFILEKWKLVEEPTANIRNGDSDELIEKFKEKGCKIKYHEYGYRSIHYIIELQPDKRKFIAEIQVRTIFEEGWSEIDHKIRYPYDVNNQILANYLVIFNRLAGSADEMGSFVKFLCDELKNMKESHNKEIEEKNAVINELKDTISKLKISESEKDTLKEKISILEKKISINDVNKFKYTNNMDIYDYLNITPKNKSRLRVEKVLKNNRSLSPTKASDIANILKDNKK